MTLRKGAHIGHWHRLARDWRGAAPAGSPQVHRCHLEVMYKRCAPRTGWCSRTTLRGCRWTRWRGERCGSWASTTATAPAMASAPRSTSTRGRTASANGAQPAAALRARSCTQVCDLACLSGFCVRQPLLLRGQLRSQKHPRRITFLALLFVIAAPSSTSGAIKHELAGATDTLP